MGRAARNHGGTGGHGCVPLPGEHPNYNRHVMTDEALMSLVSINDMKKLPVPREKQTHLGQQKGSDAQLSRDELLNHPLTSTKQPGTSAKQQVTLAKQQCTFFKKSVFSSKQPVTSAKQLVTSTKQQVTSANQSVLLDQQPVISAKHQVPSAKKPMTLAKQTLSSAHMPVCPEQQPVTSAKRQMTFVKQTVSSAKHPLSKAQEPMVSTKQPLTSAEQSLTTANQPLTSLEGKISSENVQVPVVKMPPIQLSRSKEEQLSSNNIDNQSSNLIVKTPLVNLVSPMLFKCATAKFQQSQQLMKKVQQQQQEHHRPELPLISLQEPMSPGQQSSSFQQQHLTLDQQLVHPLILDEQPFSSYKQSKSNVTSVTIVQQPLLSAQQQRTSMRNREASVQQHLTSVHQTGNPVYQPLSSPEQQRTSINHPAQQFVPLLIHPVPQTYVMNFVQLGYDHSNCFCPWLLVPVYQVYYSYFATSSWFLDTYPGTASVTPQMGAMSHQDSAHYQFEVLSTGSQED